MRLRWFLLSALLPQLWLWAPPSLALALAVRHITTADQDPVASMFHHPWSLQGLPKPDLDHIPGQVIWRSDWCLKQTRKGAAYESSGQAVQSPKRPEASSMKHSHELRLWIDYPYC